MLIEEIRKHKEEEEIAIRLETEQSQKIEEK